MKKVLVVDDESDARDFVRAILEPDGWEVSEAINGISGIEQARSLRPDLIILDVQMPDKDGFEVFNELSNDPDTKDIKVIMLTGVAERVGVRFSANDMGEFLGKEPDGYIEKPIDPQALKRVLSKVFPAT